MVRCVVTRRDPLRNLEKRGVARAGEGVGPTQTLSAHRDAQLATWRSCTHFNTHYCPAAGAPAGPRSGVGIAAPSSTSASCRSAATALPTSARRESAAADDS